MLGDFSRFDGLGRGFRRAAVAVAVVVAIVASGTGAEAKTRRPTLKWDPGIEEIANRVERLRHLTFVRPVRVELVGRDEQLFSGAKSGFSFRGGLTKQVRHLAALGLIRPGVDLAALYARLDGSELGYYDEYSRTITVLRRKLDAFTRVVVAHELTHALDDQHFPFRHAAVRDELTARAQQAVIEGDARRIEGAYLHSLPAADQRVVARAFEDATRRFLGAIPDPSDLEWIRVHLDAPYTLGRELTKVVVAQGGDRALRALFTSPPHNDVGIVDPLNATTGGAWVGLGIPLRTGETPDGDLEPLGAVDLYLMLASRIAAAEAFDAASRVSGATIAWFHRGEKACARFSMLPRTGGEQLVATAADDWATAVGAPYAAHEQAYASTVTVASCEGAAPLVAGAIVLPELLLAARGRAVATGLREHASPATVVCLGNALLRDGTYRGRLAGQLDAVIRDQATPAFAEAMGRARATCAVGPP
jgi:hypothetical protein